MSLQYRRNMHGFFIVRNFGGFTTMENLVAISIATIIAMALIGGMVSYQKLSKDIMILNSTDKEINDIAENIRTNLGAYQVNYDFSQQERERVLNITNLPMAWDIGISTSADQCVDCSGRYGFVIQPFEEFRGVFVVTLRMTHKSWSEPYRDYRMVVNPK